MFLVAIYRLESVLEMEGNTVCENDIDALFGELYYGTRPKCVVHQLIRQSGIDQHIINSTVWRKPHPTLTLTASPSDE
jgi:hypothetical protein